MHPLVRGACVLALVGVVLGLGVHYGATAGQHSPYPDVDDLKSDYDAHVGTDTLVFGTVTDRDAAAGTMSIDVETDLGLLSLTVTGADETVRPGGVVQVYGALEQDRTIRASNVVVVNPSGSSNAYKYVVSAVGALLVLIVFFRDWRIDTDALAFEVRDDG